MELDDTILAWQSREGFPCFPDGSIECPLKKDAYMLPYSLSSLDEHAHELREGGIIDQQVKALKTFMLEPPLNKPRGKKAPRTLGMSSASQQTINLRVKTILEFVGFVVQWLQLDANISHVMEPVHVAKFVGFLQAKQLANATIKKVTSQLAQVVSFVASSYCPHTPSWAPSHILKVEGWFNNLVSKWHTIASSTKQASVREATLFKVWELVGERWTTFKAKLQVGEKRKWLCAL